MIDLFSLGLCHGLLLIAALRMLKRADLDDETPHGSDETGRSGWSKPDA